MSNIELHNVNWHVRVSPNHGACILSCTYEGHPVLRSAGPVWQKTHDPTQTGYFPLVPFSNRIEDGAVTYDGTRYNIARTRNSEPHPIHGYGWNSSWSVLLKTREKCVLEHEYAETDWPWPYKATQTISIDEHSLTLSLAILNHGRSPMPAGLGFHSYFPNLSRANLSFSAAGLWRARDDNIPQKWITMNPEHDFLGGRNVSQVIYDHCFTGWQKTARISWAGSPLRLLIEGDDKLDFSVLYTDHDGDYFCFEPVTHMNNALRHYQSNDQTGLIHLKPGESVTTSMTIYASIDD